MSRSISRSSTRAASAARTWSWNIFTRTIPATNGYPACGSCPTAALTLVKDLYEGEELKSSLAYNEWVHRRGIQNSLNVRMDGPGGTRIIWSLTGPVMSDAWEPAAIDTIQSLLPHVRQFVRVRQALDGAKALAPP